MKEVMHMEKDFNMPPGTGVYYIIRSSEDRHAMIGWSTLHYDNKSGKWFEWLKRDYETSTDGEELYRKDMCALREFRRDNQHRCAQESVLEATAGVEGKVWSFLSVSVEEFRPYERREVGFVIDEYTEKELTEAKRFVEQWHFDSETRYPHIYYNGFRPSYEWEVDPISILPHPAFADSES